MKFRIAGIGYVSKGISGVLMSHGFTFDIVRHPGHNAHFGRWLRAGRDIHFGLFRYRATCQCATGQAEDDNDKTSYFHDFSGF